MVNAYAPALLGPVTPQGRLTLTSEEPVQRTTVAASIYVRYLPYCGMLVPVRYGTSWMNLPIGSGLLNALNESATNRAGPAVAAASKNYDLFIWYDVDGTIRLTRGPAWTSSTSRGTGAGTSEIVRTYGIFVNAVAITNGPSANFGTYVGSIRTDSSGGTVSFCTGGSGLGGVPGTLNVWNMYNRVNYNALVIDTTYAWVLNGVPPRPANNSLGNRVSWIMGVNEDSIKGRYNIAVSFDDPSTAYMHIHLVPDDVTADINTGVYHRSYLVSPTQFQTLPPVFYDENPGIGFHFLQACEDSLDGETTFFADHHFRLAVEGKF